MSLSTMSQRQALVVLSAITEPGDVHLDALMSRLGPIEALKVLSSHHGDTPWIRAARARLDGRDPARVATDLIQRGRGCGARVVIPDDDEWPKQLHDLVHLTTVEDGNTRPPVCLWVRGPLHLAESLTQSVTIAGARCCTPYGRHAATQLAQGLAGHAWAVVAGGGYGIDAAAHHGALATDDGVTIAVIACGIDRPYPASNAYLFDRIAETGLIVSQWPPGERPKRFRFLTRGYCLAAMTQGTVVVEAARRSGARHTAIRAAKLGRRAMIVPGPITSEYSAGVHGLARDVTGVRVVTSAADIITDVTRPPDSSTRIHNRPSRGGETSPST